MLFIFSAYSPWRQTGMVCNKVHWFSGWKNKTAVVLASSKSVMSLKNWAFLPVGLLGGMFFGRNNDGFFFAERLLLLRAKSQRCFANKLRETTNKQDPALWIIVFFGVNRGSFSYLWSTPSSKPYIILTNVDLHFGRYQMFGNPCFLNMVVWCSYWFLWSSKLGSRKKCVKKCKVVQNFVREKRAFGNKEETQSNGGM